MNYRKFGVLDWEVSPLGFSLSRLPVGHEAESIAMIRRAIDHGVNYLDVGIPYDAARHERVCGLLARGLRDGYREKVKVAVTLPTFRVKVRSDLDACLNEQLDWLAAEGVDFCVVGRLNRENWSGLEGMGLLPWMEEATAGGRVGHMGFSFHDHFQELKKVMAAYSGWSFCQFQYSYMDVDHDPGVSGIKYAAGKGLAVVVTEALKSGRLTRVPPDGVERVWAGSATKRPLAEWALRFVMNHPEVSTVVSAMSTMEELTANLAALEDDVADSPSIQDELLINRVRDAYRKLKSIPCPSCRPCMPCPLGIDAPRIFEIYNDAIMYGDVDTARSIYGDEGHEAASCSECGLCARRCAKRLPIPDLLKRVCDLFG
jgi:uncharacterized protein